MPHPSSNDVTQFNEGQIEYFNRFIKQTMVPVETPYLRRHVDECVRFGELTKSDRILEVGCGMGRYTLILARMGYRVEGLDLTPWLLERLKEYDGGRFNIPLHCVDIQKPVPELEGQFDAVVGMMVLHHILDLDATFATIARIVKPGGRVLFLEPNPYNALYYLQILITPGMTWKGDGGIVRMTRKNILGAMERAGLKDLQLERFGFFPPFVTNTPTGAAMERLFEGVPPFKPILPFQMFMGTRPKE